MTPRPLTIVGSGRRIRNNFTPALSLLREELEPIALWSRTLPNAEAASAPWHIPTTNDLLGALRESRVVVVSVSLDAVPSVLEQMCRQSVGHLTLVLDTPGLPLNRLDAARRLRRFERVIIAEDYMNFPQWELVRTVVDAGVIGEVRSVHLDHSGFRYHGMALIRSLIGFPPVRSARMARGPEMTFEVAFRGGVRGTLVEPYYHGGSTTVVGTLGQIGDGAAIRSGLPQFQIHMTGGQRPDGFGLSDFRIELPELVALQRAPNAEHSLFNALKSYGLMTVLSSIWQENINWRYSFHQGIYDHLVTTLLRQPLTARFASLASPLLRTASRGGAVPGRHVQDELPLVELL